MSVIKGKQRLPVFLATDVVAILDAVAERACHNEDEGAS